MSPLRPRSALLALLPLALAASAAAQVPLAGPLSDDTTGPLVSGTVYHTVGAISVPAGKTLTVQAGAIVKSSSLFTVNGTLLVTATAGSPAIFTSLSDDSAGGDTNADGPSSGVPGQWSGIRFTAGSDASVVNGLDVRYAGAGGWTGAYLESCDASFSQCTFRDSASSGMTLNGNSLPSVTGCSFSGNGGAAIAAVPVVGLQGISNNSASGNGLDHAQVLGGTLSAGASWTTAHALGGAIVLTGSVIVPSGQTLQLGAGLIVKSTGGLLTVNGTLNAVGSAGQPIVLTSYADDAFAGDTNGDGASSGAPGDWSGVRLTSTSDASVLQEVIVRHGGSGNWSNVYLESADVTLVDCVLERCSTTPLNLNNTSFPLVAGCALLDSGGVAMANVPLEALPGFTGNTASGNAGGDYTHVLNTSLSASLSILNDQFLGAALVLGGSPIVPAGATLTLEPGVVLKFQGGLLTVNGTLDAQASAGSPIVLTVFEDDDHGGDTNGDGPSGGAPGAWSGVRLTDGADASVLQDVIVRYGGAGNWANVYLESADVTLADCVLERCSTTPLNLNNTSHPTVSGCSLVDNGGVAMANVPLMALPGFSDNTASNNAGGNYTHVVNTAITGDLSVLKDQFLGAALVVAGSTTVPSGSTLTLEPGVVLKFQGGLLTVNGTLDAQGSESQPIVLTLYTDDEYAGDTNLDGASAGTPGQWSGVRLTGNADASVLTEVVVRYGGAGNWSNVYLESADVTLTNCVLERCSTTPLNLNNTALPTVSGCELRDNAGVAIAGVRMDALPGLSGNTASNNAGGDYVHCTVPSPTIDVTVSLDQLLGAPLVVAGNTIVATGRTLTLEPGVVLKFQGGILTVNGTLLSQGTAADPVGLTVFADDDWGGDTNLDGASSGLPGQWSGVRLTNGSDASVLEHTTVRYGGAGGWANLYLESADVTLRDCVSSDGTTQGMNLTNTAHPDVRGCAFEDNAGWAVENVPFDALPGFSQNSSSGNTAGDALRVQSLASSVDVDVRRSQLLGDVLVASSSGVVPAGVRLSFEAGITVKLAGGGLWTVNGELDVLGTLANPVVFTQLTDDTVAGDTNKDGGSSAPAPGNWSGLRLLTSAGSSLLRHAEFRWGGAGGWPHLLVQTPVAQLDVVRVERSAFRGIELNDFASATHLTAWQCAADGLVVQGGGADVLHVSSVGNTGAGVRRQAPWTGALVNAIAWDNAGGNYAGFAAGDVRYSNGDATLAGVDGNLFADPLFVDAPGGDLGLSPGSPSIDTGDPATGLDLDGSPRDQGAYFSDPTGATPDSYCTAKTTSNGCVPFVDWIGTPSATANVVFEVFASDEINNKVGLLFYGTTGAAAIPFQGGLICVGSPIKRTTGQFSGGNPNPDDCSGRYTFDFNAYIQSGFDSALVPGAEVRAQYWGRDLGDPFGSSLSDALRFVILP